MQPAAAVLVAAALFIAADVSPALAFQGSVNVQGRVVAAGTDDGIGGATVELGYVATRETGGDGGFRFAGVPAGRYVLRVTAIGYRTRELTVVALRDTTVTVELGVAPIALDTLAVRARQVTVKGVVRDAETGVELIDVEVAIGPDLEDTTDPIGRYEIEDVPAGPEGVLTVRGFGYLPVSRPVELVSDTTLDFELEKDPVVQRMIDVQVAKLVERSRPQIAPLMPAITREELMRAINWTLGDIIQTRYAEWTGRVRCVLIDDVQREHGEEPGLMLPDRIERVEVLFSGRMIRIYTRDYIRRMLGGGITLNPPRYIERMGQPPICL